MKLRSSYVPQSSVDSIDILTKNILSPWFCYSSGVLVLNYFGFQVCARDGIEIKVTKGHVMLSKLVMHGEDHADKILDQSLVVLTQSCSSHGEFSLSK